MGGRGASSSYGKERRNTANDNRRLKFYDKTDKYKGMNYLEFEDKIRNRKNEWVGLYDENGKIIVAGTSYKQGAVAIPTTHPDFKKATSLTHNHPAENGRMFGGPLSEADVINSLELKLKSSRAVAKEKTYILSKNSKANSSSSNKLYNNAVRIAKNKTWHKQATSTLNKIKSSGKKVTDKMVQQIYYGTGTRIWKNATKDTGYDYIEKKNR